MRDLHEPFRPWVLWQRSWSFYDTSLAVSLDNASFSLPDELAEKLRMIASNNDEAFENELPVYLHENLWRNLYGSLGNAQKANMCMLRYRQTHLDTYRDLILHIADSYYDADVDLDKPVWPGTLGDAIFLMLNAYELTEEDQWLQPADRFARISIELFLSDGSPLPNASHLHDNYEAITKGDTLMMALLKLWQVQNKPHLKLDLIYTDRT
ncbi:MAG: hypothetical protein D3924_11905 [Candidatus Electrothrix sp. AR4]|nr:hypothetical protein [Candidatus Electrothrix sp. AR4]